MAYDSHVETHEQLAFDETFTKVAKVELTRTPAPNLKKLVEERIIPRIKEAKERKIHKRVEKVKQNVKGRNVQERVFHLMKHNPILSRL